MRYCNFDDILGTYGNTKLITASNNLKTVFLGDCCFFNLKNFGSGCFVDGSLKDAYGWEVKNFSDFYYSLFLIHNDNLNNVHFSSVGNYNCAFYCYGSIFLRDSSFQSFYSNFTDDCSGMLDFIK
jgi:hypothetical protein